MAFPVRGKTIENLYMQLYPSLPLSNLHNGKETLEFLCHLRENRGQSRILTFDVLHYTK